MKKRRTLIISLLLVAALVLGIGYATLSQDLLIKGSANLNPNDDAFDVIFISAEAPTGVASTASFDPTTANYDVKGLYDVGDSITFTFKIQNLTEDESINAYLKSVTHQKGTLTINGVAQESTVIDQYFTKETSIRDGDGNEYVEGTEFVLAHDEIATVTVTVTLKKVVADPLVLTGASIALNFSDR